MVSLRGSLGRMVKLALIAGLVAGIMLIGLGQRTQNVYAQDGSQTFYVQAGGFGPMNVEILGFAPVSLKVHRGDTVVWVIHSFHNIHFAQDVTPYVIFQEVNGQETPIYNPAVAFPSIASGATFSGGDANSGLPDVTQSTLFSLVIDLEPGVYAYFCDVHFGMVGSLEVVADDVAIPAPAEAAFQGSQEIQGSVGQGLGAAFAVTDSMAGLPAEDGDHQVMMGAAAGRATSQLFFPDTVTMKPGETVTFFIPEDSNDGHTANWPPNPPEDLVAVIEVPDSDPILGVGPGALPTGPSGLEVDASGVFNTGIILPGQSFTVKFTEPGVYSYICNLHPGQIGTIVVSP